jgi:hypothetical protein
LWEFEQREAQPHGNEPDLPDPKPSVASSLKPLAVDESLRQTSRTMKGEITGEKPARQKS